MAEWWFLKVDVGRVTAMYQTSQPNSKKVSVVVVL